MGRTPRRRQLTGCRRRLPMRKATSCGRAMHLSHAEVGFRDFLQSLFAVTCHSSRSAMQAILPILALSLYFTDGGRFMRCKGDTTPRRRLVAVAAPLPRRRRCRRYLAVASSPSTRCCLVAVAAPLPRRHRLSAASSPPLPRRPRAAAALPPPPLPPSPSFPSSSSSLSS